MQATVLVFLAMTLHRLLRLQHNGLLIATIFYGLCLMPLGYIAYRSARCGRIEGG